MGERRGARASRLAKPRRIAARRRRIAAGGRIGPAATVAVVCRRESAGACRAGEPCIGDGAHGRGRAGTARGGAVDQRRHGRADARCAVAGGRRPTIGRAGADAGVRLGWRERRGIGRGRRQGGLHAGSRLARRRRHAVFPVAVGAREAGRVQSRLAASIGARPEQPEGRVVYRAERAEPVPVDRRHARRGRAVCDESWDFGAVRRFLGAQAVALARVPPARADMAAGARFPLCRMGLSA
ncbi:hypothetical protein BMAA1314 [Burkholderia mallei ATCC 23344]|uniref:Uncharacterized protein n=1 Tax=Burkholderia mallei (strain ATCC 23344) TaxID=243160 RepID=A0A0H2WCU2_BURMA|nr:hypothetical protein BMAA1314 [Burkholderia mallei ATCC 23344]